ncbi:MAG: replication initiation protein [Verrucomicrobia bacterium]|nr:replication initiation protein [Verrucomicrobiota bacterium]
MPRRPLSDNLVFEIQPTRESLVWQKNQIADARYKLSPREQKLLLYVIAMIDPDAEEFGKIKVSVQEYAQLTGLKADDLYDELRQAAINIRKAPLVVEHILEPGMKKPVRRHSAWFEYVDETPSGDGYVTVKLISWLKPYLLQVRSEFFKFRLGYALDLNSEYAIRLYQYCKRWQFARRKSVTVDQLRLELGATEVDGEGNIIRINLEQYKHFKSRALVRSIAEINAKTDLALSFGEEKFPKSKAVRAITFTIELNPENEHKLRRIPLPERAQMELTLDPEGTKTAEVELLLGELVQEFGLSAAQRRALHGHLDQKGLQYVLEKAEIVRSQPRENAGRAYLAALRDNWRKPVPVSPKRLPRSPKTTEVPEPPGWREWLRGQYPRADIPGSFTELQRLVPSVATECRRELEKLAAANPNGPAEKLITLP